MRIICGYSQCMKEATTRVELPPSASGFLFSVTVCDKHMKTLQEKHSREVGNREDRTAQYDRRIKSMYGGWAGLRAFFVEHADTNRNPQMTQVVANEALAMLDAVRPDDSF